MAYFNSNLIPPSVAVWVFEMAMNDASKDGDVKKINLLGGKGECSYLITHNSITPVDEDSFYTFAVNIRTDFATKYLMLPKGGMKCEFCEEISLAEEERIAYIRKIHATMEEGEAAERREELKRPKKKVVRKKRKKGGKK
jgi:hypothetical protein